MYGNVGKGNDMAEYCEPCSSCSISGKKAIVEKLTQDLDELMSKGAYNEAYPVALRMLDEGTVLYGTRSVDFASVLNDVASVERYLGYYDKAEQRFDQVAEILLDQLGRMDPEYATALNNLAGLHRLTHDYERAEKEFNRSLEIYEKTLGETDWHTISCYNNLGLLYQDQGKYEDAIACHVKALELLQSDETPDDPASIATTLMNGAICSSKMGDVEEATELFDYAKGLIEQVNGKDSAAYATALNNIAAFKGEQGDWTAAVELLEESKGITGRLYGSQSDAYTLVCDNLDRAKEQAGA